MQRVNDWWFYQLGWRIHCLLEINEGMTLANSFWKLAPATQWLNAFLKRDEIFPFKVSLQIAGDLKAHIESMLGDKPDWDRALTNSEVSDLGQLINSFETIASAEVSQFNTYSVVKKLAYDTRTLLEEGESLIPEDVRAKIPDECITDLREAAKCMAFEVSTASGFHTIRATESVIRLYYKEVVGSLPKLKDRNWGTYIRILKAKGADPRVTGFLDHIRESYRNPISHPEQRLDPQEAQVLLGVCVSAIIQIVGAIDALRGVAVAAAGAIASPSSFPALPSAP